ncbi:unnamed protein product, partial [Callosobruchus maculatus]
MPEVEICNICNKVVSDDDEGLLCDECAIWKHRACLGMAVKTYLKISKSKDNWYCQDCQRNPQGKMDATSKTYTLNDVMAKLEDMDKKYNRLLTKFNEQSERYAEQVKINENLQRELNDIKKSLNKQEQAELAKNIIVQGIPYKEGEDANEIVRSIAKHLGVQVEGQFTAFRLGKSAGKSSPLKIVFEKLNMKQNMFKSKRRKELTTGALGYKEGNRETKVFLNHDLTKDNLKLYTEARLFKKTNDFKYLWMSGGNIFLRKSDSSKVIDELVGMWPGCHIVHGKPRHSQSQGSVERANQDMENKLASWMKDTNSTKWSEGLKIVQFQKNRCFHSGIGRSPYEALYGVKCRDGLNSLPISIAKIKTVRTEEEPETLLSSSNASEEKILEVSDPSNNYVPDEKSTINEDEMVVEEFSHLIENAELVICGDSAETPVLLERNSETSFLLNEQNDTAVLHENHAMPIISGSETTEDDFNGNLEK